MKLITLPTPLMGFLHLTCASRVAAQSAADSVQPILLERDCAHHDDGLYRMLTMALDAQLKLAMTRQRHECRRRWWRGRRTRSVYARESRRVCEQGSALLARVRF